MNIKELNKRLELLINEFNDNIIKIPKLVRIPDHYHPTGYEPTVCNFRDALDYQSTEVKLPALNDEKFKKWTELFEDYKQLKGNLKGYKFKRRFKKFTNMNRLGLFTIDLNFRVKYRKEWREYA